MRLWNLMTGRKAGVLSFGREVLNQVGEDGRRGGGEGRRVLWGQGGEVFVVGFERGAVVYGVDSKPKAVLRAEGPRSKVQQMRFLPGSEGVEGGEGVLAVSTEDGRVLFYDTRIASGESDSQDLPSCPCLAELGGERAGISGRIKDFEVLRIPSTSNEGVTMLLIITGSSDGAIRLWTVLEDEIIGSKNAGANGEIGGDGKDSNGTANERTQVGTLIGTLETGNRITCLGAFVMDGKAADAVEDELPDVREDEEDGESGSESAGGV